MSRNPSAKGTCVFCQTPFTKSGMTKHLAACPARQTALAQTATRRGAPETLYHLRVQSLDAREFWLDLEMQGAAPLKKLDQYLRAIWLECCGHLSRFSLGGWTSGELPMSRPLEAVLAPGAELTHIYDFGTSSETLIKAVSVRQGHALTQHPIFLMARNEMPLETCAECGQPALWLCMDWLIEKNEWHGLCNRHAKAYAKTTEEAPVPIVNSPRLGMCGYTGPADPPY